ncbi:hypothetical protein [Methanocella sp. MCL-LM]|uniref:hypothetical protein n=1 Tax=Methanocella sp. MCL-LM TaxID=3412035 RepID=UPI003C75910A
MKVFDRPGPANTDAVIDVVKSAASSYDYIVVASITGDSAVRVAERIKDKRIICVTCPQDMCWEVDRMGTGPFADVPELKEIRDQWAEQGLKRVEMNVTPENRARLEQLGVPVVRGTIPFFGPSFSIRLHLNQVTSLDMIAKTLELISTGTLVCLECVLMCVDAGVMPEGQKVIALAGTERGLDTAWVIRGSASANLFHPEKGSRFVELLAKPGVSLQPAIDIEYLR